MSITGPPEKQGLYDPAFEKDSCGVGFVVHVKGHKSHEIVEQALTVLLNLRHRGACGCETNTGDGAGILLQIPHEFMKRETASLGFTLPGPTDYGVGMVFLSQDDEERLTCERDFERIIEEEGQQCLGWRTVPTDDSDLGPTARVGRPVVRQVFIRRVGCLSDDLAFERTLYVIRRRAENTIRYGGIAGGSYFYVPSLSSQTIIYKGMLNSEQVKLFYPELADPSVKTALALVHSRFSTNTFPSWDRAHPYRYIAHNGEINTLRGNVGLMHARQAMFASELFGDDIKKVLPVIAPDGSDSAMFDNTFELMYLAGRSLAHVAMMMIPEPWTNHESMSPEKKAFYEYHACLMEPWDGPASIAFTNGVQIGAVLDRNGLRPSRYYVTKDDLVIMASEVGVLEIDPEHILYKGRLQPGRMFLVDTAEGRIVADEEIKNGIATSQPYREWLDENQVRLDDLPAGPDPSPPDHEKIAQRHQAFGYTFEEIRTIMAPMGKNGVEPIGSMGTDTPLAALSNRPHLLYNYFKQLFAQVTNPPIDAIREAIVTSTVTTIGTERNLLDPEPKSCRLIKLQSPILTNEEFQKLQNLDSPDFKSATLPIMYNVLEGGPGLEQALEELYEKASSAIDSRANIIILSDRGIDRRDIAPIPALLAVAGLHHHLIREGTRTKVGLVLESGEPREVHHFSLLVGYGCGAINPYLAFETLDDLIQRGLLTDTDHKTAVKNYAKAIAKGVVKSMSKMGISTIQSYRGAQIFEAVGLNSSLIDKYFTWTSSRIEGVGLDIIAEESARRQHHAFTRRQANEHVLDTGGEYQWRYDGEYHLFNPETVQKLQLAVRTGNYDVFKEFTHAINDQSEHYCTLRGLLKFKERTAVPIEEVESVDSIVRRFKTCLLYTSPSPRDRTRSRMPSSA